MTHNDFEQAVFYRSAARKALSAMTDRERKVVVLVFGLDGQPACTDADVAKNWGVSKGRVNQIRRRALDRARQYFDRSTIPA